jgi:hypothetical protein
MISPLNRGGLRTIDIEIDIFYPHHRIINRIMKFPLSHRLIVSKLKSLELLFVKFHGKADICKEQNVMKSLVNLQVIRR